MRLRVISFSLYIVLLIVLSPSKIKANESELEGLSDACHVASLFIGGALIHGGLKLYNLSGQVSAGITMTAGGIGTPLMDEVCDATASSLLEYAKSHAPLDYKDYIDQYCKGDPIQCPDPLLSLGGNCGPFEVCPNSPLDCKHYIACMEPMLGNSFTPNELIVASSLFAISWEKGYWYTPNFADDSISWDIE